MNRPAMQLSLRSVCAVLIGSVLLSSCGGGGSGGNGNGSQSAVSDSQLQGVVVDGYLVGAKVCLDLNTNWVCDPQEPSTVTTAGGKYTLDVSPLKYWDTYSKLVLAEVGPDAYDEDAGKTLKEQGIAGYTLGSQGGPRPIISPMNTLGMANYLQHGLNDVSELSTLEAAATANGLSKTGQDYFDPTAPLTDSERDLAKKTGRILAKALANAQAKLIAELPELYSKGSAGLGARVAGVVSQALKDTETASDNEAVTEKSNRINQQIASVSLNADAEKLKQAKTVVLSAAQALSVLDKGLYDASLLGSLPRSWVQLKSSGHGGSVSASSDVYRANAWVKDTNFQSQGSAGNHALFYTYTNGPLYTVIVDHNISIPSAILLKEGDSLKEKFSADPSAPTREIQVIAKQVDGLPFSSVAGLANVNGNFSAGHTVYQVRRKSLNSEYVFDEVGTFFKSLDAFVNSPRSCYASVCWSITRRSMGNAPGYEGTIRFTTTSAAGSLELGEGKYVADAIGNKSFFRVLTVPLAVQNRSGFWSLKDGRYPIFADFDDVFWVGKYSPAGSVWTSEWLLPGDALNAVLATLSVTEVLN